MKEKPKRGQNYRPTKIKGTTGNDRLGNKSPGEDCTYVTQFNAAIWQHRSTYLSEQIAEKPSRQRSKRFGCDWMVIETFIV
jgi:hypothetical protein